MIIPDRQTEKSHVNFHLITAVEERWQERERNLRVKANGAWGSPQENAHCLTPLTLREIFFENISLFLCHHISYTTIVPKVSFNCGEWLHISAQRLYKGWRREWGNDTLQMKRCCHILGNILEISTVFLNSNHIIICILTGEGSPKTIKAIKTNVKVMK